MYQGRGTGVDQSLYLWWIDNVGQSDVKVWEIAEGGADGGEISVEKDGMKHG